VSSHIFYIGVKHDEPSENAGKSNKTDFVLPFWCMRETLAPNMTLKDNVVKVGVGDEDVDVAIPMFVNKSRIKVGDELMIVEGTFSRLTESASAGIASKGRGLKRK
jgi:hypothetical protein